MTLNNKFYIWILLLVCTNSYGQMNKYDYQRELKGITEQWHKVVVPNDVFGKVSPNLSDIRIIGITANKDTLEAPYLLRRTTEKVSNKDISCKIINTAHNEKGYYFTFEVQSVEAVNQIKLDFKQKNFDWRVKVEGSQNQEEWFTIIEDYRILAIKNELTNFRFTKISFPEAKYRFFRLHIPAKEKPELTVGKIAQYELTEGTFNTYPIERFKIKEDKKNKQTRIEIDLQSAVSVSHIKIDVKDNFDYYRPITIKCLTDSFKTEVGWKYNYKTLANGTLNSIEENEFKFNSTTVDKLLILIHNRDNAALAIDAVEVKGYVHELVARFTEPANYFMVYGYKNARKPQYDIVRFKDKIPEIMTTLRIGEEVAIEKTTVAPTEPLFKNKTWLWATMAVIILLLGWFSLRMLSKK